MENKITEWIDYFEFEFDIPSVNNRIQVYDHVYSFKKHEPSENQKIEFLISDNDELSFKDEEERNEISPIKEVEISNLSEGEKDGRIRELNFTDENKENIKEENLLDENREVIILQGVDNNNNVSREEIIEVDKENVRDVYFENNMEDSPEIQYKTIPEERKEESKHINTEECKSDINDMTFEPKRIDISNASIEMSNKKKDNEIKYLSEKLDSYKSSNKLILDENKKLLEIISIFKQLQEIDSKEGSKQNNNTLKDIKISKFDHPESPEKKTFINTNKDKKTTSYSNIYKKKEISKPQTSFQKQQQPQQVVDNKTYIRIKPTSDVKFTPKKENNEQYIHSISSVYPASNKYYSPINCEDEIVLNDKNVYDFEIEDIQKKEEYILTSYENEVKENYNEVIDLLDKYKRMNEKLMKTLTIESENKINVEERKRDVENLSSVLDYINSIKDLQDRKDHVIPFYLVEKKKIYNNMMKYIFEKKDSPHIKRNISKVFERKMKK
jgi:hypothetical protein